MLLKYIKVWYTYLRELFNPEEDMDGETKCDLIAA